MNFPQMITVPSTPANNHTHTVIFLHGRGDTASNFAFSFHHAKTSLGQDLRETFPSIRWIFPQAVPLPNASSFNNEPVSQWFDIWNARDFSEHEELQAPGLCDSVARIRYILASEAARLHGRWDHIILAGISQGAATAVHTMINLNIDNLMYPGLTVQGPRQLGAFLGFSARMPFAARSFHDTRRILALDNVPESDEVVKNTPVLLEHCCDDPVVMVENGRVLRDTLRGFGAQVAWYEYPSGGHWFNSPSGMDDVVNFLKGNVDGLQEGRFRQTEKLNLSGGMGFV